MLKSQLSLSLSFLQHVILPSHARWSIRTLRRTWLSRTLVDLFVLHNVPYIEITTIFFFSLDPKILNH